MSGKKNETTEWEDIQVRLGNWAPRNIQKAPTDLEYDERALENGKRSEEEQRERLQNASLDELNELEDDNDEKVIEEYRKKRMEEMRNQASREKFGSLMSISEPEYKTVVTDAPPEEWVVVFLTKPGIKGCDHMEATLRILAKKFKTTKFVSIRSDDAIRNYPDKNLPTLLIYHASNVIKQFIGLASFGGESMTPSDLEWGLTRIGAVESEMEEDPRSSRRSVRREDGRTGYDVWNDSDSD